MKNDVKKLNKLFDYKEEKTAVRHCNGDVILINAVKKHYARARQNENIAPSVNDFCKKLIVNRLNAIAKSLPDDGLSMGSVYDVRFSKIKGTDDRTKEYSHSCKYRANHNTHTVNLDLQTLLNMQVIGGVATFIYPGQKSNVKKCWWFEGKGQKSMFEIIKTEGFIYAGFHHIIKSEALAGGKRIIENRKIFEKYDIEKQKKAKLFEKHYRKALKRQYCFNDSLASGNCEAGTRAFILRCHLNSENKYRGSFLLKIANEKSTSSVHYVENMIRHFANISFNQK